MQISDIICFLVSLSYIRIISSAKIYNFDKTSKQCGEAPLLGKNETISIKGSGKVPDGYCGIVFYAQDDMKDCKYPAICANVNDANMSSCKAKVTLSGKYFSEKREHSTELGCKSEKFTKFCTQGGALRLEVIEEVNYAKEGKTDYSFDITVTRTCSATKEATYEEFVVDDYRAPDYTEAKMRNYIIGIVVACCLASIFLVILIVMKCYYKSQPYAGIKDDK